MISNILKKRTPLTQKTIETNDNFGEVVEVDVIEARHQNLRGAYLPPMICGTMFGAITGGVSNFNDVGGESAPASATVPDTMPAATPTDLVVNPTGEVLTGKGELGSVVTVQDPNGTVIGSATVAVDGNFSVPLNPAQQDGEVLSVTVKDAVGESAPVNTTLTDTIAPAAPSALAVSETGTELTGKGEAGANVEVKNAAGVVLGTAVVDASGKFVVTLSSAQISGEKLSVTLKDAANNTSSPTESTAPVVLMLTNVGTTVAGFVINGEFGSVQSGYSVSNAGDVNGDGFDDLIIGSPFSDPNGRADAGRSYVVYGKTNMATINLTSVAAGSGGFVINGNGAGDNSGFSVSGAGDVNGDGFSDLIVGASRGHAGDKSYVVFGRSSNKTPINLSTIEAAGASAQGFMINDQAIGSINKITVSGAGDVNGDGFEDLIVSSVNSSPGSKSGAGSSYVVFGKATSSVVNLTAIASGTSKNGFIINGANAGDESGWSVSSAGDINGDGLADLLVSALQTNKLQNYLTGTSYVVFGKKTATPIDLSAVSSGIGGFAINGVSNGDLTGFSVCDAGDVNGDGLADMILTAPANSWIDGGSNFARAYVVYGKTSTNAINLSQVALGVGGFVLNGGDVNQNASMTASNIGDVNGDGLSDFILGAPLKGGGFEGVSYVIFGKTDQSAIDLKYLGINGFSIKGSLENGFSGFSVSGAGDVNGDGLSDLIVSEPGTAGNIGRSYVILGSTTGKFTTITKVDQMGTSGNDNLNDGGVVKTLIGGAGNDILTATAASVLYGGQGNDTFIIGQAMITALQSPIGQGGNTNKLARIDGGHGEATANFSIDTIQLAGANLILDFTKISNQSGSSIDGGSRVDSIERIMMTDSTQKILLTAADVLDMGTTGAFSFINKGPQLMISSTAAGTSKGTLDLVDAGWKKSIALTFEGETYYRWINSSSTCMLYVEDKILVL